MASFKGEIKSAALDMDIALNVILPYDHPKDFMKTPCKVLYLLHGQSSSSASWMRWTSIERYAIQHGFAVIMPEVQRSFYRNMAYGLDYFTFVADELPKLCQTMFHISAAREDNYIAGLSMGGYGALKIGLSRPEQYCAIGSFSGAADIQRIFDASHVDAAPRLKDEMIGIFGPELKLQPQDDILHLTREHARLPKDQQCRIFISCGTQDEIPQLYNGNLEYLKLLQELGISHTYYEQQGMHEWALWDQAVQKALEYFDAPRGRAF